MISFLEHTEHWENTEVELATRGVMSVCLVTSLNKQPLFFSFIMSHTLPLQVKHLNFYDIVLDFILMDSFEDLENPPISIQNVINNRWLNSSFKETVSQISSGNESSENKFSDLLQHYDDNHTTEE